MKALEACIQRYFPCSFDRGGSLLVVIGFTSTLVYVFCKIGFKHDLRDLPQNLMVLTFLISAWGQRQKLKSDLIVRLMLLAILIPWLLFAINALIDYEAAVKYRSVNDLLKLFLFLPLAWWIGGSRPGALRMLTIAFAGLVAAVAMDPNLGTSLAMLWAGQRVDFNIHNAQHGAMFFGLTVIFCACALSQRLHDQFAANRGNALLLITGLLCLAALLGTRTRAAIVGLLVAGLIAVLRTAWQKFGSRKNQQSRTRVVVVLLLLTGLLAWPAMKVLQSRLAQESVTLSALLAGNLDEVPFSSFGIRVHSWAEALKWIADRPVTGWGQKARTDVIQLSQSFPDEVKEIGFGHLHNGYLEILLGFGIVGFVFVAILWVVLWSRIRLAADNDLFAFALYGGIFFLVLNLSESFFIYWSGEFALALIMAGGYSQYLAKNLANEPPFRDPKQ